MSSSSPGDNPGGGRLLVDEPAPGVARLTISNPSKRGALDQSILDGFTETLPELDARCVIITGQAPDFCAGYDLGSLSDSGLAAAAEELIELGFERALRAIEAYPHPTLAALSGHTIGGGLEIAVTCDLRIAADSILLAMPPARLGVVYSRTGVRKFIDSIGASRTRELFFTARRIDAQTALSWGLVNTLSEPDGLEADAVALAADIAAGAPLAQAGNKWLIRALLESPASLEPDVERELAERRREAFHSADFREGVTAFIERRAPRFGGR